MFTKLFYPAGVGRRKGEEGERRGREGKGGGRGGEKLYKFQVKEMEGFASCSKLLLLLQAYFQRLIHTQLLQPL